MKSINYKLRLSIRGVEIEVVGDRTFVEKKFNSLVERYLGKGKDAALSVPLVQEEDSSGQKSEERSKASIHNFVNTKKPRSLTTELMPVLVYFAKRFEGLGQFNESDIKKLYRRYDISKRPKNIYQAILDINRNKGYFESVPKAKGYFRLTEAGEYFVETKLPKD